MEKRKEEGRRGVEKMREETDIGRLQEEKRIVDHSGEQTDV